MHMTSRPQAGEYASFFHGYVSLIPETDVLSILDSQPEILRRLTTIVTPHRELFAYAPGKWTNRQVVGHLGDGERVFGFRAFSFSRSDKTALPGFDENQYVQNARFNEMPLADLVEDFALMRQVNLRMLRSLGAGQWDAVGTANGNRVTVRALAFIMAGHVRHHLGVLRERYAIRVDV
jgi:hypothetical protein